LVRERSHVGNANFDRVILQSSTKLEMQMLMVTCFKSALFYKYYKCKFLFVICYKSILFY